MFGFDAATILFLVILGFLYYRGRVGAGVLIMVIMFGLLFAGTTPGGELGDWMRTSLNDGWSRVIN